MTNPRSWLILSQPFVPRCAAIEHSPVITKIPTHLGLPARSTAPSSGQGLRSIPTGLIPHRSPIPSGSAPEPTLPCWPRSLETPKRSET